MAQVKQFSLRPLLQGGTTTEEPPVALEGSFRIHMRREDMDGLMPKVSGGDPILLKCESTGSSGVGIAFLDNTMKNQGGSPFVKISHAQNQRCGFAYQNKCTIAKYEGPSRKIDTITISDVTPKAKLIGATETVEDLEAWAAVSLAQLGVIHTSGTFDVQTQACYIKGAKRQFKIEKIVEQSAAYWEASAYVPYYFDLRSSKVVVTGDFVPPLNHASVLEPIELDFEGLQGLDAQLETLRSQISIVNRIVDDHTKQSKYNQPCPILIHGPSGVGKTSVLSKLEGAAWKKVVRINESCTPRTGAGISRLFTEATANQPSLVAIDDLELLGGQKSESGQLSYILSKEIQKLTGSRVQIVATTKRLNEIDERLLHCFEIDVEFPVPTSSARYEILQFHTVGISTDVLQGLADRTHAFTARDLGKLCRIAHKTAKERDSKTVKYSDSTNLKVHTQKPSGSEEVQVIEADFEHALLLVHPSIMNEAYIEVPKVHWKDIAGSNNVKEKLWEAVNLPLEHPDVVEYCNVGPTGGILLYGPPGCSKTLTAKALATESGLNFIAVKGPELISKYVGDSEYKIREVFRKARAAAPSVIFFDEVDSIAPNRGGGSHEGLNTVATLLNEMDGVEDVKKVLVLAATNRPDAIDPALLRPGRFGTTLYIGPPQKEAIEQILNMHTKKMHPVEELGLSELAEKMSEQLDAYYSGADVYALCHAASILHARDCVKGESLSGLRKQHLLDALEVTKPSLSKLSVGRLEKWSLTGAAKS